MTVSGIERDNLIFAAQTGDPAAIGRLLTVCQSDARRYARRHCQVSDVDDAVHARARCRDGARIQQITGDNLGIQPKQIVARTARPDQGADPVPRRAERPRYRRPDEPRSAGHHDRFAGHPHFS